MKPTKTIRDQSIAALRDWIWPCLALQALFGIFFVLLPPPPSLIRLAIAGILLAIAGYLGLSVRYRVQAARRWFLFDLIVGFSWAFFWGSVGLLGGLRLRWPEDVIVFLVALVGLTLTGGLTWCFYVMPVFLGLLENDCQTGRFNLVRGTYSPTIIPTLHFSKSRLGRKIEAFLLTSGGVLIAIGAASGVHGGERLLTGKDIGFGLLALAIAMIMVATMTCTFYTYCWIRRWEKSTGRTMWIEGFEPPPPPDAPPPHDRAAPGTGGGPGVRVSS